MSFLNPSPQEEQEYVRRVALGIRAADLLLAIKLMALNSEIAALRETMRATEALTDDVDVAASERYLELVRLKGQYGSTEGCNNLRMEILGEMFKRELEASA